ncbi:DUF2752 domain-containing protein [Hymenobacter sp. 15J16-1T3B]|uniref:DUF2752 domain-containing protein n=1 Tax=Hymenobacter sp. 15J16-1T3B TaxID=2886941 RepID=UPI001D0FD243|nr:DUF2752 domain-containing protein [Hymenobacter sp. 15J16-1T3B]MCC3156317.1 DUF2752 domain-containing protein [Hymenobacter sp. 15J16-1T3B]
MSLRLLGALAAGAAGLAVLVVYYRLDPSHYFYPRCLLHWATGLHCPGCGTQRALHALLHGRWAEAAGHNLLAALYAPVLAFGATERLRAELSGQPRRNSVLYRPWFGWLTVTLVLAFAVLRNLPGPLGQWLAP